MFFWVLQHGCSPVNLLHVFRTPFLKNTSGRLLSILTWCHYQYPAKNPGLYRYLLPIFQSKCGDHKVTWTYAYDLIISLQISLDFICIPNRSCCSNLVTIISWPFFQKSYSLFLKSRAWFKSKDAIVVPWFLSSKTTHLQ